MTLRGKGTLEQQQEQMRLKNEEKKQALANRPLCISCNLRRARLNGPYCSRCSIKLMINQHRDTLPGLPSEVRKEVMPSVGPLFSPEPISPVTTDPVVEQSDDGPKTYTRQAVCDMLSISATTLMRWEKKGKVPQPMRISHSNHCVYTDEMVELVKAYKNSYYTPPPVQSEPGSISSLPRALKHKQAKISKSLERSVALRLGSLGRMLK